MNITRRVVSLRVTSTLPTIPEKEKTRVPISGTKNYTSTIFVRIIARTIVSIPPTKA